MKNYKELNELLNCLVVIERQKNKLESLIKIYKDTKSNKIKEQIKKNWKIYKKLQSGKKYIYKEILLNHFTLKERYYIKEKAKSDKIYLKLFYTLEKLCYYPSKKILELL